MTEEGSALYSRALRMIPLTSATRHLLLWGSFSVLGGLVVVWLLLATLGAVASRSLFGPVFYGLHLALFFLAVPALANILVITRSGTVLASWFVVGLLGAMLALPVVLTQYAVSEALYGIDGERVPFASP
jgi:hypothetical protein